MTFFSITLLFLILMIFIYYSTITEATMWRRMGAILIDSGSDAAKGKNTFFATYFFLPPSMELQGNLYVSLIDSFIHSILGIIQL
jgi:hypothetical protein